MSISYDNRDNSNIPEFKIMDSIFSYSDEYKFSNDESISSENALNYPIFKKPAIKNLKYSDTTEDGSSDSLIHFESKFGENNTLKRSDETYASLPKEDTPIPEFFILSSLPLPSSGVESKEEEEELKIDELSISNETNSFNERDRSGHHNYQSNMYVIEETKTLNLDEETNESFSLEKSDLKYCTKSPIEMYEYLEKNEKVICSKENNTITKLCCLKEKSSEEFVCVLCAIKNEMKPDEFEDWCDYSKKEQKAFKKCIVCNYFKPLFAYIKRNNDSRECREIKTCLFCRNKKKLKKSNNKTTEPYKLPPISHPSINQPIVKPLFIKPDRLKDVGDDVIDEEINEYLKNKIEKRQCCNCEEIIFTVDGFEKEKKFFCKDCLILIKLNNDKKFRIRDYADPIYKCYDYEEDISLIYCTRCRKYKRISSFLSGDEKKIKMSETYCRSCALKRQISNKK